MGEIYEIIEILKEKNRLLQLTDNILNFQNINDTI